MKERVDIREIQDFLDRQGLSFKPLRAELLDHLVTDVEHRMRQGDSFQDAWNRVKREIPKDHFNKIQIQTMETINSRFRISRIFSNLFLALIMMGSLFKFMHWPGAGILLISSFTSLVISLLFGSLTGIIVNKSRNGSIWVISMISGIVMLLAAFSFRLFQFPGAEMLAVFAVVILILSSVLITYQIGRQRSNEETLLTFLHEKYTSGIQRSLLVLLSVGILFKVVSAAKGADYFVGNIMLILLIYGAGIHLLIFFWRSMEIQDNRKWIQVFIIMSSFCLFLPILNFYLPFAPRMVMALIFYITSGYFVFRFMNAGINKPVVLLFMVLNIIHFSLWSMTELEIISSNFSGIIYNVPIAIIFLIPFWVFRKDHMLTTYWIVVAAAFTLQFAQ